MLLCNIVLIMGPLSSRKGVPISTFVLLIRLLIESVRLKQLRAYGEIILFYSNYFRLNLIHPSSQLINTDAHNPYFPT